MRFAEVFLRLGTALVAWMMLVTYFVWLAVMQVVGCGPDGDEMHRLLLGLAPFTCVFAALTRVTIKFPDIHALLRWLTVPLVVLTPFCLRTLWGVFETINRLGQAACGVGQPPAWQSAWVPLQMLTLAVVLWVLVKGWRASERPSIN